MDAKTKRRYRTKRRTATAKEQGNSFNLTLNDSYWMDSFDKLVQEEPLQPLRERNRLVKKAKIRKSFNQDSSFEDDAPTLPPRLPLSPIGKLSSAAAASTPQQSKQQMFFNYISTPATARPDDSKALNLDAIVSSEGENSSVWQQISFPNASQHLLVNRQKGAGGIKDSLLHLQKKILKTSPPQPATPLPCDKPRARVAFQVISDDEENNPEASVCDEPCPPKRSSNFVLKPGKWRKSIANIRRTMNQVEGDSFHLPQHQRNTIERLSSAQLGRHRKSIYIPPVHNATIDEDEEETDGRVVEDVASVVVKQSDVHELQRVPATTKTKGATAAAAAKVSSSELETCSYNNRKSSDVGGGRSSSNDVVAGQSPSDFEKQQLVARFAALKAHVNEQLQHRQQQLQQQVPFEEGQQHPDWRPQPLSGRTLRSRTNNLFQQQQQQWGVSGLVGGGGRPQATDVDAADDSDCSSGSSSRSTSVSEEEEVNDQDDKEIVEEEDEREIVIKLNETGGCGDEQDDSLSLRIVGSKFARQLSKSHSVVINDASLLVVVDDHVEVGSQVGDVDHVDAAANPQQYQFIDAISPTLSVRDTVLRYCGQTEPLPFSSYYSEAKLTQCRKVGEGVYSEVFMYRSNETGKGIVLKVIPIEGQLLVNGEFQKRFDEILSEIIISKELSNLRYDPVNQTDGFVSVEDIKCVRGVYPAHLIDLWELYRENHTTDNDHPGVFGSDQLFIVLELENAGQDLEAFHFTNAVQGYSAFVQTALILAVAEAKYQFEHRDLHWGNLLLRHTEAKEAHFILNGKRITVPTEGVQVTIIDYTLSRMLYKNTYLQYNDLAQDDDLFSATGDYQFEIYRLMRKRLNNHWAAFDPYTNVLWLHYVIDKMINGARYRLKQSKKHRNAIKDMIDLRDTVLDFNGSVQLAKTLFV